MTFDPALNPGEPVNGQTPQPPIDRHLDAVYSALAHGFPGAIDDLHTAARSAGHLFGNGVADALGRIVGNLGDLTAGTRSDLVYLRRAIDDRHAAMLIELDAAHRDAVIHRHLVDEARVELAAATVDATTRLMALQDVRRKLTDVATFAKTSGAVDWFAVVDSAVRTIDAATADPGNGDPIPPPEHDDYLTGELIKATTVAVQRRVALEAVRAGTRDLRRIIGKLSGTNETITALAVITSLLATLDDALAGGEPADPEPGDLLGRWPRSHAEAGVAPDPDPVFVNGRPIRDEPVIVPAEPGDTAAGS